MKIINPLTLRKDYRTSYRLLIYILMVSSVFTVIGTGVQLFFDYRRDIQKIYDGISHIKEGYLDSLASNVWSMDEQQIRRNLQGAYKLPDIQYLEVRETWNASNVVLESIGEKADGNVISRTFPLEYGRERSEIGTLLILASKDAVIERLKEKILIILSTQALKTFFVSIAMLMIFYYLVMRHLNAIKGYFDAFRLDQLNVPLSIKRDTEPKHPDEFSRLVKSINFIREGLNTSFETIDNSMAAIQDSEARWRSLTENSPIHIFSLDRNLSIEFANFAFPGKTVESMMGTPLYGYIEELDKQKKVQTVLESVLETGEPENYETEHRSANNKEIFYESHVAPKLNHTSGDIVGLTVSSRDITARKEAEQEIQSSLREKETLLQEIHHRVKNNMQVITSLLKLQENNIEDRQVKGILKDCQSRVYAMSAVHEALHGSGKLSEINLKTYLNKVTTTIFQTYSIDSNMVKLVSNIDESSISIDQAYPLGLVVNELVSNSMKYAFPESRNGEVALTIEVIGQELKMIIKDNGVGIPAEFDWKNSNSLGLQLVSTLVEDQLNGSIDHEAARGTTFTIKFTLDSNQLNS